MKLTVLKGIAHDLANNISLMLHDKDWGDFTFPVDTNVLEEKNMFDKHCLYFFKERLPKTFDFNKIQEIRVKVIKLISPGINFYINVKLENGKEVSYKSLSIHG